MSYKQFGIPSQRNNGPEGIAGEYNFNSSTFQPRFNDCYIHCPEFGTDPENKIIWTPGANRINTSNPSKDANIVFSFEESALNPKSYSELMSAGLTMYYKTGGSGFYPRIRDIAIPFLDMASGITYGGFLTAGSTGDPTGGSTFSWSRSKDEGEFCMGFPMGVTLASPEDFKGIYTYYIVNRNESNDGEIAWRVQYIFGLEYNDESECPLGLCPENLLPPGSGGITLPPETYILSNPAVDVDESNSIPISVDGEEKTIIVIGNTADNYAIDYSLCLNNPNIDVYGTDSPSELGRDPRPYTIEAVPRLGDGTVYP